jgi:membrane protein implicated in regulation of membrane protease activity
MTWANVYLTCFLLGLSLSLVSFLLGAFNLHGLHLHLFHGHGGPHVGHGHAAHGASPFNFATITAFLAWFGGAGYLLTRYGGLWGLPALVFALLSGLAGGGLMFWFMAKVVWSPHENLNPDDYDVVGLLGVVSSSIREGGTGEILYPQAGTRRTAGARSENGQAIARGVEVVITQYKQGLVYVRPWAELSGEHDQQSTARG